MKMFKDEFGVDKTRSEVIQQILNVAKGSYSSENGRSKRLNITSVKKKRPSEEKFTP